MTGNGNDQVQMIRATRVGAYREIRVRSSVYRGTPTLDIREYFMDDAGEWQPSRKGVCFKLALLGELLEGLNELQSQLAAEQAEDEPGEQEAA